MVRQLAAPFVAVPPSGTSTETRLSVSDDEDALLWELYRYGGKLKATDLRCLVELNANGIEYDEKAQRKLVATRKRNLTQGWSSRVAGAIYRENDKQWDLAKRNLEAHADGLKGQIKALTEKLALPVGSKDGCKTHRVRSQKRYRLECLERKLNRTLAQLDANRLSICLGGKALARNRHNLEAAGLTEDEWRLRWDAARGWFAVNGSKGETFGNQTARLNPSDGILELLMPPHLAHLSNTPGRRPSYRFSGEVRFKALKEEWEERIHNRQAVRYELDYKFPVRNQNGGWYLKASWAYERVPSPSLADLRWHRTLAVDLNADHVACCVLDGQGNPVGMPFDLEVLKEDEHSKWTTGQKDAKVREVVKLIFEAARAHGCRSVTIENLNFSKYRKRGREARKFGKRTRKIVMGMPTAVFRDRLVAMLYNSDDPIYVIAVDPAYTSVLGRSHWLPVLRESYSKNCTAHQAAAVVIGRRGQGFLARRSVNVHEAEQKSRRRWTVPAASVAVPQTLQLIPPLSESL